MPRGFKSCSNCGRSDIHIATRKCKCGEIMPKKAKGKKCPKCKKSIPLKQKKCSCGFSKLTTRRHQKFSPKMDGHYRLMKFVGRMLPRVPFTKQEAANEVKIAKFILHVCCEDYDFLAKFKKPSWVKNTLLWFRSKDGIKHLKTKYNEYLFEPEETEDIFIDEGSKKGEDILKPKPRTLRQFLDE